MLLIQVLYREEFVLYAEMFVLKMDVLLVEGRTSDSYAKINSQQFVVVFVAWEVGSTKRQLKRIKVAVGVVCAA